MANVLRYGPAQISTFYCKDRFKDLFSYDPKKNPWLFFGANLISGGLAGACSLSFVYPFEYVRSRLAADIGTGTTREFAGMTDCILKAVKNEGMFSVYRGYSIAVIGIIVYRGMYFGLYDTARGFYHGSNFFMLWACAQFITLFAGLSTYPIDTIRRRMMMQIGRKEKQYTSYLDCISRIREQEGYKGFFKGAGCNILQATFAALTLVAYNEFKSYHK